eukprot:2078353-Prymnesium_polylepis.1
MPLPAPPPPPPVPPTPPPTPPPSPQSPPVFIWFGVNEHCGHAHYTTFDVLDMTRALADECRERCEAAQQCRAFEL